MTLDDCFSLFIAKSQLFYDGKVSMFSRSEVIGGNCAVDILKPDEKNPDKQIVTAQESKITFRLIGATFDKDPPIDLSVTIKTVYVPAIQYWNISNITVVDPNQKEIWLVGDYLHAPLDHSYSCGNLVLHRSPSSTPDPDKEAFVNHFNRLVFKDFQIQPFKGAQFNESYGCESWFSIGTFAGLLVLILFTMILALGIMYMVCSLRFVILCRKPPN